MQPSPASNKIHIRKYLITPSFPTAIHSLVLSNTDYCNCAAVYQIARLQWIENHADHLTPFNPNFIFDRRSADAFCFLRVLPVAVSTRHSWLWQTWNDVYTRNCFSLICICFFCIVKRLDLVLFRICALYKNLLLLFTFMCVCCYYPCMSADNLLIVNQ